MAAAEDFTVRPFLWDVTLEPRDIIETNVVLTNQSERLLRLYATVNEITVDGQGEVKEFVPPIETDRTSNVTSWIEITRGRINIEPGASEEVTVSMKIHPEAVPGEYHAFIGFYDTNKRFEAEAAALRGAATGLPVKVTLAETINADLYVSSFAIPRFVISPQNTEIQVGLTNNGDSDEIPDGEIIFYTNRGQEIAAAPFNSSNEAILSGETSTIRETIALPEKIGRYSASLSGQYGSSQREPLVATTTFFVMPLWFLVLMSVCILLVAVLVTVLLRRVSTDRHLEVSDEVEVPVRVRAGYVSEDKEHDITLSKK